jgi:hypothetical protein
MFFYHPEAYRSSKTPIFKMNCNSVMVIGLQACHDTRMIMSWLFFP